MSQSTGELRVREREVRDTAASQFVPKILGEVYVYMYMYTVGWRGNYNWAGRFQPAQPHCFANLPSPVVMLTGRSHADDATCATLEDKPEWSNFLLTAAACTAGIPLGLGKAAPEDL